MPVVVKHVRPFREEPAEPCISSSRRPPTPADLGHLGSAPHFVGLLLYRFGVNVRASLVLGLVGAGGIGFLINQSIKLLQFNLRPGTGVL